MEKFGKYILVDKISSGGMADVFRAKVLGIRGFTKTVAIKRIHAHLLDRTQFLRMFTDEAKIASRLVHPNIVQIYDLGETDEAPYIAMEYVAGRDLFRVLQRLGALDRRCPWGLATKIVDEVCTGLHFAHEFRSPDGQPQEIVHRDISPRNIIITYNGEVKLTDFGVARARDREEETQHGVIKGKVRYLSPEAAYGKEVDRRSDLFSLGIVFAEMLIMAPLRTGDNEMAMLLDIRKGEFDRKRFAAVPESLQRVLDRALEDEPDDRYATALEFATDLAAKLDEQSSPMSQAEISTFMHSLFAEDIEREEARDEEVERELQMMAKEEIRQRQAAPTPEARSVVSGTSSEGAAERGPGPAEAPFLKKEEQRPENPDEEGSIQQVSLCRILHQIHESGTTGLIDFRREPIKKTIQIENGEPVFADSNLESELFGEHMVNEGLLSRDQHRETLDFAARKGIKFTEALLALGACTPNIIFQQLSGQVRNRILDLFSWVNGTYAIYADIEISQAGLPLNLSAYTMIHEGVQERLPLLVVRRFMEGRLQQTVLRVPGEIPADLQLSGRQQRILRAIEEKEISIEDLIRRERNEEWILRLLYMLHEIQRVVFRD